MSSPKEVLVIDLNKSAEYQKLLDGQPQTCGMRCGRVYLKPGQTCGRHNTGEHEETLVFLSGRGELLVGEEDHFAVGQGKISYILPNTVHDVKNTGNKPLIYIYCVAPVGPDKGCNSRE
jgi:quercetin dioxygenase-like cupin family protein